MALLGSPTTLFTCVAPLTFTSCTTRGSLPKIEPSIRSPPSAKLWYARAISSGVAGSAPSPIAKYPCSGVVIPSSFAVSRTLLGPTSAVSCEKTELSEYAIAWLRLIGPSASPS